VEEHITETERELERWDDLVKQHHSRLKEYEEIIAQRSTVEEGYAQLTEARRQNDELNQKLGLLVKLRDSKSQLEMSIERAQATLITEHKLAQSKITELEAIFQKLPKLKNELQQAEAQWQQLAEQEEMLSRKKQTSQELRMQVNYLESNKTRLEREIQEIQEKLDLLLTQNGATCPLCEAEVGRDGLKRIEAKYTTERDSKAGPLKSNQAELKQAQTGLTQIEKVKTEQESRLNSLRQEKEALENKRAQLTQLEEHITETERELERWDDLVKQHHSRLKEYE
ncbi:unnamed protein product, partial [marine sediment metagenome]